MVNLSLEKWLELAEDYADPQEWPEDHMLRCLAKAKEIAKKKGVNISKKIKRIKQIWNNKKSLRHGSKKTPS